MEKNEILYEALKKSLLNYVNTADDAALAVHECMSVLAGLYILNIRTIGIMQKATPQQMEAFIKNAISALVNETINEYAVEWNKNSNKAVQ